jgi:hypothetical protein
MMLPYKRWINLNKEFLQKVIKKNMMDAEYLEHLQSLGKEQKPTESMLHPDGRVLLTRSY